MQHRHIIAPVKANTGWVRSMAMVKKQSGKLLICIDLKPLNKALNRCPYPLPTIDDILVELSKARIFVVSNVMDEF